MKEELKPGHRHTGRDLLTEASQGSVDVVHGSSGNGPARLQSNLQLRRVALYHIVEAGNSKRYISWICYKQFRMNYLLVVMWHITVALVFKNFLGRAPTYPIKTFGFTSLVEISP